MIQFSKTYSKPAPLSIFFACMIAIMFASCKKQQNIITGVTLLSVYNFSPTVATYDVYLNNTKINTAALPFGGGIKYQQFITGSYDVNFNIATTITEMFKKNLTFPSETGTLYLVGKEGSFEVFYANDSNKNGNNNKSNIRFVNLCADAPPMNLNIKGGVVIAKDKAFKTNSDFIEIDPGTFTFEIKETAGGTLKAEIVEGVLAAGHFYTVAFGGNYAPANENERPVGGVLILHK